MPEKNNGATRESQFTPNLLLGAAVLSEQKEEQRDQVSVQEIKNMGGLKGATRKIERGEGRCFSTGKVFSFVCLSVLIIKIS